MAHRALRPFRRDLEQLGLTVVSVRSRNHVNVTLENQSGEQRQFTIAATPSDHRAFLNARAMFRRFART